jgi:hypothetical protein
MSDGKEVANGSPKPELPMETENLATQAPPLTEQQIPQKEQVVGSLAQPGPKTVEEVSLFIIPFNISCLI